MYYSGQSLANSHSSFGEAVIVPLLKANRHEVTRDWLRAVSRRDQNKMIKGSEGVAILKSIKKKEVDDRWKKNTRQPI